ncbi:MAG TPA: acetyl-CoA carboxylase biotin carboxylase subunit [Armatimonadota bacterium]|nr:acetyl-CoA carboxylase biotin carboxylase subunit [Armatimonadota bacterium]
MFKRILIANRGEIAIRVIRACHELGIESVAVFSEADSESLHVRLADEAVCIGPPAPRDSYLDVSNVVSAAIITGCDAIHPGYGLLSEVANFAEVCEQCQIKFIGPPPSCIAALGDKAVARELVRRAGVPTIPGSKGVIASEKEALRFAHRHGFPIMIKAVSGGGGRGVRRVYAEEEMARAFSTAQVEAEAAFGDASIYLEKYIERGRHIEVQLLGDSHGNLIHLGERDCTCQTSRYQKMVEEAPSFALTPAIREQICDAAIRAGQAAGYENAGTVEFLLDENGSFYFLEMNTRLQVEHPVTEMVTGIDLVRLQILIAAGEHLPLTQDSVTLRGHSIECRVTAEDPDHKFTPTAGQVKNYLPPGGPGVRVDSFLYSGYTVAPYYDSMVAKIIVWDNTRDAAINRMLRALRETEVQGIKTSIPFLQRALSDPRFRSGDFDLHFVPSLLNQD